MDKQPLCWDGQYHDWRTNHLIDPRVTGGISLIGWYCTRCRSVDVTRNPPPPLGRPYRSEEPPRG